MRRETTPAERAEIYEMRAEGLPFREIAARTGRHLGSLTRILKSEGYRSHRELAADRPRHRTFPTTRYEDDPASLAEPANYFTAPRK